MLFCMGLAADLNKNVFLRVNIGEIFTRKAFNKVGVYASGRQSCDIGFQRCDVCFQHVQLRTPFIKLALQVAEMTEAGLTCERVEGEIQHEAAKAKSGQA